jgi:hypothetical protein
MKTTVVNIKEEYDIYCGRPSKWGNPFIIGKDGTREEVIEKFKTYIQTRQDLIKDAKMELKGKRIACYCSPLSCHCDILAQIADS